MDSVEAEIMFPTLFSPNTLVKKGLCSIVSGAAPAHNLYFELHSSRHPVARVERLVFIPGLNSPSFTWKTQVAHFAAIPGYEVLVFDNRGVGNSDSPRGRYSTSMMARDVHLLLDHLGWTEDKSLHVVGCSMGGMIAQELSQLITARIASLSLLSTQSGIESDLPSLRMSIAALYWWLAPKTEAQRGLFSAFGLLNGVIAPEQAIKMIVDCVFPASFLNAPDPSNPGRSMRDDVESQYLMHFRLARRQPFMGRMGHISAACGHRLTLEKAQKLATLPKVAVIAGLCDKLITPARSFELHQIIRGSEYILVKDGGHALSLQCPTELNDILARVFNEGRIACTPVSWTPERAPKLTPLRIPKTIICRPVTHFGARKDIRSPRHRPQKRQVLW